MKTFLQKLLLFTIPFVLMLLVYIALDYRTLLQYKPKTGHLFVIPPQLVNNKNILSFQLEFLKAFLSPKFIFAYIDFKILGEVKQYMKTDYLIEDAPISYDNKTNEIRFTEFEKMISEGKYFTEDKKKIFYQRDTIQPSSPISIAEAQKIMLQEIFDIFNKHQTNYKVIINPLYNQVKLNQEDLKYLIRLFGKDKVFDFSGVNKFTNDYKNYYETEHYRPTVANEVLNEIYKY